MDFPSVYGEERTIYPRASEEFVSSGSISHSSDDSYPQQIKEEERFLFLSHGSSELCLPLISVCYFPGLWVTMANEQVHSQFCNLCY